MDDPEAVGALMGEIMREHVAKTVAPLVERIAQLEARGPAQDGRDGLGLAGAVIDRDGRLVVTLSDGTVRELGPVVGRDGRDGERGADALGLDDLSADFDGDRTLVLRLARGEVVKEIPLVLPIVVDRGVWREGATFAKGDGVTFGGSFWIAQQETSAKPGEGEAWRLAVKRGRDGRDAAGMRARA